MPKKKKQVDPAVSAAASVLGKRSGIRLTPEQRKERASKAGKAAVKKVGEKKMKERNSKAGKTSWESKTPEEREAHIKKLVEGTCRMHLLRFNGYASSRSYGPRTTKALRHCRSSLGIGLLQTLRSRKFFSALDQSEAAREPLPALDVNWLALGMSADLR